MTQHAALSTTSAHHQQVEVAHRIEALVEQEQTFDVAAAVHSKGRTLLLQIVNYLIVSVALSFQTDLNNSTSQLAMVGLIIVGYMLSDIVTAALNTMLVVDGFSRGHLAVFVQFCTSTPLSFISYIAINVVRDNVIPPDTTPRLEVIIPISVLLCWAYIEMLFQETRASQLDEAYAELARRQKKRVQSRTAANV